MKCYRFFILVFVFILSSQLYAKQYEYEGSCRYRGNNYAFEECLRDEYVVYDKKLNDLYNTYFKRYPDQYLRDAEQHWVKFKEADCGYMARVVNDGKSFPVIYKACQINRTKERIRDLQRSFYHSGWFERRF